jgi:UDP-glucose 4-epimerase
MRILVTGGTGYVGSHVCVDLIAAGHDVVVVDNLANSRYDVLDRIAAIAGKRPRFLCLDIRHGALLRAALRAYRFDGVAHLAGMRSTEESMREPSDYYRSNVAGTANVIDAASGCPFVLSSSASVYGDVAGVADEDRPPAPTSAYGRSKLAAEMLVRDVVDARGGHAWVLRVFNPAGAHKSGRLGDDPRGAPCNLVPRLEQVAVGVRERLAVYGSDYATGDGTAVRDYVHVMDVARAHRFALESRGIEREVGVCNLGTGRGSSVLDVVAAFERASGRRIPCRIESRRRGDAAECRADVQRARRQLGFVALRGLDELCADALRWRRYWLDCLRPPLDAAVEQPTPAAGAPPRQRRMRPRPRPRRLPSGL